MARLTKEEVWLCHENKFIMDIPKTAYNTTQIGKEACIATNTFQNHLFEGKGLHFAKGCEGVWMLVFISWYSQPLLTIFLNMGRNNESF